MGLILGLQDGNSGGGERQLAAFRQHKESWDLHMTDLRRNAS